MLQKKQEELLNLIKEKDDIEKEILELTNAIEELNKKGMIISNLFFIILIY